MRCANRPPQQPLRGTIVISFISFAVFVQIQAFLGTGMENDAADFPVVADKLSLQLPVPVVAGAEAELPDHPVPTVSLFRLSGMSSSS